MQLRHKLARQALTTLAYECGRIYRVCPEDLAPEDGKLEDKALTHPDSTSVQPLIRGDWVLFHPVYSDEEIKAVKVCTQYTLRVPVY